MKIIEILMAVLISTASITPNITPSIEFTVHKELIEDKVKPVIIYPGQGDKVYSEDSLAIRYYDKAGREAYAVLSDENGIVNITKIKSGDILRGTDGKNKHTIGHGGFSLIDEKYIEPEKTYKIQIFSDYVSSDVVEFSTFTGGEEAIKEILEKRGTAIKKSVDKVAPSYWFTSSVKAAQMMETIEIKIWKLNADGEKYTSKAKITVNKNIKNNYIKVFKEIYALGFPINSVGCYNYRNTHGGRLSEHALGTAVDINPTQNYCLYSDGTKVGSLYAPYKNPYSVTSEVIAVFKKYGFSWGGDWGNTPDYMHFSYFGT